MTKPQLRVLAIVLGSLILVVLFAGLDDLPRRVRAEIASEQQSLSAGAQQLQKVRNEIMADLAAGTGLVPRAFHVDHASGAPCHSRKQSADGTEGSE